MAEYLEKLRPDRDLQVYFERPSAIAALSAASAAGFTVSGTWRQQFDWCVIEWNRDNVFEHPLFRPLPDGDLSGLQLTYDETRENCIPLDSSLFPTVDWPNLRVWAYDDAGVEQFYRVPLRQYATPIAGAFTCATASFTLSGSVTAGDAVGVAWLGEHHTHVCYGTDTAADVVEAIRASVMAFSTNMLATRSGTTLTLTYVGEVTPGVRQTLAASETGANGNILGAYTQVTAGSALAWDALARTFSGGTSPTEWRIALDFGDLHVDAETPVPCHRVRKLRWTYAAAMQTGAYERSEFAVTVRNWAVTGTGRRYRVAGPGSRRIESSAREVAYYGTHWAEPERGNFSDGQIRWTDLYSDGLTIPYRAGQSHELYLGTRLLSAGPEIALRVDDEPARVVSLRANGEDVLMRVPLGTYAAGEHTVYITHNGPSGWRFWFDFLEIAVPADQVEDLPPMEGLTAATDWDTDHSLALPAERTAWMLHSLGFHGRANHYVGALLFYELYRKGHVYASATIDFPADPEPSEYTEVYIGRVDDPGAEINVRHLNLYGDTAESIAKAYELEFNRGYTAIRAEATGARLTIFARAMGLAGEQITVSGSAGLTVSSPALAGANNGTWTTDTSAAPAINRACRDWSREFHRAMAGYGFAVTAAFSTEMEHADQSEEAGIAQRYADGEPCVLTTPAVQTNFSPVSRAYWKKVHREMAAIQDEAGQVPYLQLGEVQWWYFPGPFGISTGISLPYYDEYTKTRFEAAYGFPIRTVADRYADPAAFPEEAELLPALIGEYTEEVIAHVRAAYPDCRYEVLYPTDVNDTPWGRVVNYPESAWTPATLDCLKTESFSYTFERDLTKSRTTVEFPASRGFYGFQAAFLVGPGDPVSPWRKEVGMARQMGLGSIVLFALDQFCLVGYGMPVFGRTRRSRKQG